MTAGSAAAIELGPIEVHSKLGHPLRASIAFALGPNESIAANCVSLRSGASDFPVVFGARVSVANGVIALSGNTPINEPLMSANLVIDCPYTAHVSRNFTVFLDPSFERASVTATTPAAARIITEPRPEPRRSVRARPQAAPSLPIEQGSTYVVQPGDSLSRIAQRLQGRVIALQPAMSAIYNANPEAFENGDPNRLHAGSVLVVPSLAGSGVAPQPAASDFVTSRVIDAPELSEDTVEESASLYGGAGSHTSVAASTPEVNDPVDEFVPPPVEEPIQMVDDSPTRAAADSPVEASVAAPETPAEPDFAVQDSDSAYAGLLPGDVIFDESAFAEDAGDAATMEAEVAPPPRQIAGSRIIATPPSQESPFSSWLLWLVAGALSLIGAYVAFGQRLRERFGWMPFGSGDAAARPQSEHSAPRAAAITVPESTMSVEEIRPTYDAVDFDLSDDAPTEENFALDADLIDGTGFEQSADVAVNEDFGFASTTSLDLELPDMSDEAEDTPRSSSMQPRCRIRLTSPSATSWRYRSTMTPVRP
jgi:FimV-like protein